MKPNYLKQVCYLISGCPPPIHEQCNWYMLLKSASVLPQRQVYPWEDMQVWANPK